MEPLHRFAFSEVILQFYVKLIREKLLLISIIMQDVIV